MPVLLLQGMAPSPSQKHFQARVCFIPLEWQPLQGLAASIETPEASSFVSATRDSILKPFPDKKLDIRTRLKLWHQTQLNLGEKGSNVIRGDFDRATLADEDEGDWHEDDELVDDVVDNQILGDKSKMFAQLEEKQPSGTLTLTPGDLVALRNDAGAPALAVYLQRTGKRMFYFTNKGRLQSPSKNSNPSFISKDFLSAGEVQNFISFIPKDLETQIFDAITEDLVPRKVGGPVIRKLNQFQIDSDDYFRKFSKEFSNAHQLLSDKEKAKKITLEEATEKLTGVPHSQQSGPLLLAVNHTIMRRCLGFSMEANYAFRRFSWVESQDMLDVLAFVMKCVHAFQQKSAIEHDPLRTGFAAIDKKHLKDFETFIFKCRRLIRTSRAAHECFGNNVIRSKPFGMAKHESLETDPIIWSRSDQSFIRLLTHMTMARFARLHPMYRNLVFTIIRATGMYKKKCTRIEVTTQHLFLVEIGVISHLTLPLPFDRLFPTTDSHLQTELEGLQRQAEIETGFEGSTNFQDSFANLRKDWGDMPVYCIDRPSTKVVDDGFSLEPISDGSGRFWLHVHIAHPSARLNPEETLARNAARQAESIYLTQTAVQMFPDWFNSLCSLQPHCAALTVSVKLSQEAEVLEYRIRPSIIHNVIRLSYEDVDDVLAPIHQPQPPTNLYSLVVGDVGQEKGVQRETRALTPQEAELFRMMDDLSVKLSKNRSLIIPEEAMWQRRGSNIFTSVAGLERDELCMSSDNAVREFPQFGQRDPTIQLSFPLPLDPSSESDEFQPMKPAQRIVGSCMALANEIIGQWAAAQNVPMPFTSTYPPVSGFEHTKSWLTKHLKRNPTDTSEFRQYMKNYNARLVTSSPIKHRFLGSYYVKMTSPLRRYYDLLAGWQIDAALLMVANMRKSLPGTSEHPEISSSSDSDFGSAVPFSRPSLDAIIKQQEGLTAVRNSYVRANTRHWRYLAIARSFYLHEGPPVPHLIGVVATVDPNKITFSLPQVELYAKMTLDTKKRVQYGNSIDVFDKWELKIEDVDVFGQAITIIPVRRIQSGRSRVSLIDHKFGKKVD